MQSEIKFVTICTIWSLTDKQNRQNKSNKKFNHHRCTSIHQIQYKNEFILCFEELYAVLLCVFPGANNAPLTQARQDFPFCYVINNMAIFK